MCLGAHSEAGSCRISGSLRGCVRSDGSGPFSVSSAKLVEWLSFPRQSAPAGCGSHGKIVEGIMSELATVGIANTHIGVSCEKPSWPPSLHIPRYILNATLLN